MTGRRSIFFGLLAGFPLLCVLSLARGDDGPPPGTPDKPEVRDPKDKPDEPGPGPRGRGDRNPGQPNFGPGNFGGPRGDTRGDARGGTASPFPGQTPSPFPGQGSRQPNWPQNPFGGMRQSDPEMEKLMQADVALDHETRALAEQYRQAPKDKQDEIKKKLQESVTKQFEARQERRTLELKRLEEEIKRIRESIDKRNASKDQIVDRRVAELLGQDDSSF